MRWGWMCDTFRSSLFDTEHQQSRERLRELYDSNMFPGKRDMIRRHNPSSPLSPRESKKRKDNSDIFHYYYYYFLSLSLSLSVSQPLSVSLCQSLSVSL